MSGVFSGSDASRITIVSIGQNLANTITTITVDIAQGDSGTIYPSEVYGAILALNTQTLTGTSYTLLEVIALVLPTVTCADVNGDTTADDGHDCSASADMSLDQIPATQSCTDDGFTCSDSICCTVPACPADSTWGLEYDGVSRHCQHSPNRRSTHSLSFRFETPTDKRAGGAALRAPAMN